MKGAFPAKSVVRRAPNWVLRAQLVLVRQFMVGRQLLLVRRRVPSGCLLAAVARVVQGQFLVGRQCMVVRQLWLVRQWVPPLCLLVAVERAARRRGMMRWRRMVLRRQLLASCLLIVADRSARVGVVVVRIVRIAQIARLGMILVVNLRLKHGRGTWSARRAIQETLVVCEAM